MSLQKDVSILHENVQENAFSYRSGDLWYFPCHVVCSKTVVEYTPASSIVTSPATILSLVKVCSVLVEKAPIDGRQGDDVTETQERKRRKAR